MIIINRLPGTAKTTHVVNGITYKAIKVADKIYIPDNTKII